MASLYNRRVPTSYRPMPLPSMRHTIRHLNLSIEVPKIKVRHAKNLSVDLRKADKDVECIESIERILKNLSEEFSEKITEKYWSKIPSLQKIESYFQEEQTKELAKSSLKLQISGIGIACMCLKNSNAWQSKTKLLKVLIQDIYQSFKLLTKKLYQKTSFFIIKRLNRREPVKLINDRILETIKKLEKAFCNVSEVVHSLQTENSIYSVLEKANGMRKTPVKIKGLLPEIQDKEYTLVLDLDETLVHLNDNGMLLIRPYCTYFLNEVSKFYEICVFTAGLQLYADWAIDTVDQSHVVKHRLYRQHTDQKGPFHLKDLCKIGRDLEKIVIVDNSPVSFSLQPDNGVCIPTWTGQNNDSDLKKLVPLLNSNL